ncbi:MAG: hypothetical protein JNJ94_12855 [Chlorobi bacterium]|jgi:predicted amino acid dehydrogenase|nr:hypothetical protein [Chlorobiota bacterium]
MLRSRNSQHAAALLLAALTAFTSIAIAGGNGTIVRQVKFARGKTSTVLRGVIKKNQEVVFVLNAKAGQTLTASVDASTQNNDVVFSISGPNGSLMDDGMEVTTTWRGQLPASGEYRLTMGMMESKSSRYAMNISVE